ncbi:uncharacterized protein METZ01_LOCUS366526, partial [marine metagenome]
MQIYLFLNGEQVGPYSVEQVQAMLGAGTLMPDTQAWHETLPTWVPVTQLVGGTAVTEEVVDEEVEIPGEGEVILRVTHQAEYSRGQLLLRTFLGVFYLVLPHAICLAVLGFAIDVCMLVAWFAILFTGQYPAVIYQFVVSVHQWGVRWVATVTNLGDGYPAFGLGNKGNAVSLQIIRPVTSSRLHCVLRILTPIYVGIPHGICLLFRQIAGIILFIVAFFAVLFTGKYPK